MSLFFALPGVPSSTNKRYKVSRSRQTYKTDEARNFEQRVADHSLVAIVKQNWKKTKDACGLEIVVCGSKIDIDNCLKAILDALQRHVYFNDNQVEDLHVRVLPREQPPCVGIKVWSLE